VAAVEETANKLSASSTTLTMTESEMITSSSPTTTTPRTERTRTFTLCTVFLITAKNHLFAGERCSLTSLEKILMRGNVRRCVIIVGKG